MLNSVGKDCLPEVTGKELAKSNKFFDNFNTDLIYDKKEDEVFEEQNLYSNCDNIQFFIRPKNKRNESFTALDPLITNELEDGLLFKSIKSNFFGEGNESKNLHLDKEFKQFLSPSKDDMMYKNASNQNFVFNGMILDTSQNLSESLTCKESPNMDVFRDQLQRSVKSIGRKCIFPILKNSTYKSS